MLGFCFLPARGERPGKIGSARESGGHRDFGGFDVLDGQENSSRRCWGNVGTRVRCGFPSAEGEPRSSGVSYSSRPPSARHFHSKAANSAHFLRNRIFGLPDRLKSSFSRKPPKMHPSSDSCAVPAFVAHINTGGMGMDNL